MSTLVLGLVLLGAVAHASWNAMLKGKKGEPLAASTGLCVVWAVVGWPLTLVVPAPDPASWALLAASVGVHLVYFALLVAAYRRGDLSFVYTIARGVPPLLVALAAWVVVGEDPGWLGLAGVGLIAMGVLWLGLGPRTGERPLARGAATPPSATSSGSSRSRARSSPWVPWRGRGRRSRRRCGGVAAWAC